MSQTETQDTDQTVGPDKRTAYLWHLKTSDTDAEKGGLGERTAASICSFA